MIELTIDKELVAPWVAKRARFVYEPNGQTAVGLVDGHKVLAGAVYEAATDVSVRCHVAIDNPQVPIRKFLIAAFHYPFVQLGVNKLIGFVPSANVRALRFDFRLGFTPEAIIKDVYPDGDMVIVSMLRHECRYIPQEYRRAA